MTTDEKEVWVKAYCAVLSRSHCGFHSFNSGDDALAAANRALEQFKHRFSPAPVHKIDTDR